MSTPQELPWIARPFRELVRLSWPVTVSMLSYAFMTLVDTFVVGKLGAEQLAGVGLGGVVAFTLISFGFGLMRGGKTLVSQAVGAGRRGEAGGYLGATLLVGVGFGLLAILVQWPVAAFLGAHASTAAQAGYFRTYLLVRSLGAPSVMVFTALREVRYGEGDARSPMIASVIANAVNIALAWWFVMRLGFGVAGAGWATVIAQTVEPGVLAIYQTRTGWNTRGMRRSHLAALVKIGTPTGIQMLLEVGAFAVLSAMVASMSPAQMAAHQIALQLFSFSFLPAFAIGESASVMAGQAIGAVRDELVLPIAYLATRAVTIYTFACSLLFALCAPQLIGAFSPDPTTLAVGIRVLHAASVFLIADGANIVARSILRATGDVKLPAWIGVVCSWCMTPPLAWLLGFHLGLGAYGGWLGLSAEVFVGAMIQWWRLQSRGWLPFAIRTRADVMSIADGAAGA